MYKRDPRASVTWIVVCVMIPFVGPFTYYLLGVNRVQRTARAYRKDRGLVGYERSERSTQEEKDCGPVPHHPLSAVGAAISGHLPLPGNAVTSLYNGDEVYAHMLEAIATARESVRLSTYIFETKETGRRFVDALAAARERGVEVRVLIDGVGQHYGWPSARRLLRRRGVDVRLFLPFRLLPPALHFNLRNHRKILVVDGVVAFTGGINIGHRHVAQADGSYLVTDVHFEMRGPIVSELDNAFCEDWLFAGGKKLQPAAMDSTACGPATCRLILDDPGENLDRLAMVINGVVGAASRRVDIMTPYFLPSRELIAALQAARSRGVQVRVVLPAKNNLPYMHWATRNLLWELLMWDIEVCYQQPPFCHSKLLVVDDEYALVGSANLDPRSLRLNFELGVEVFDEELVSRLSAHFAEVCSTAYSVTLAEVDGRPLWQRLRDSLVWLFSPYL
ncbi:MAG: PLDc N-terminal domain-containing protein [Gammaproteobacteria bacterium]|nr:PLDc N-terminal domain-containing protein [Gammaproteobacteria bacterium]NNF61174.1 cardiolipin synthase [Gammaproteobacteria bacterium]NNM19869.1 cardiolipin synthase [Gammaproteobacteria bacterium]